MKGCFAGLCKLAARTLNMLTLALAGGCLFAVFAACMIAWLLLLAA